MKYLKFLKIGDFKELLKIEFYKYSPVYIPYINTYERIDVEITIKKIELHCF